MINTSHILNGNAILPIFKQSDIAGKVVIWLKMLCEEPIESVVGSDYFLKKRRGFFEEKFSIGSLEYFNKTIKIIQRLNVLYQIYLKRLSHFYEIKTDVYQLNDLGKKSVIN